jgi:hypothetical protein
MARVVHLDKAVLWRPRLADFFFSCPTVAEYCQSIAY